ncbi:MAG: hypothetical protein AAB660_02035 [Patescibacteria group bacterium]
MPIKIQATSVISKKLGPFNTPEKIQDFINKLPFNHEKEGETYRSVEQTLTSGRAHCFEGALVAAASLLIHGHKPLLMDIRTTNKDIDHVVALFKIKNFWGAISKTNHAVLRYREPVYKSVRELAMSYFHEYFLPNGIKTMREFSKPFDLSKTKFDWLYGKENLFGLIDELDSSLHEKILPKNLKLRKADKIEIKAGEIIEWPK